MMAGLSTILGGEDGRGNVSLPVDTEFLMLAGGAVLTIAVALAVAVLV